MNITLPIVYKTDSTATAKGIKTEFLLKETTPIPTTFYSIIAISPFTEGDVNYTLIHTNGTHYICTLPYFEIWDKLK